MALFLHLMAIDNFVSPVRALESEYVEWSKALPPARCNLAISGVPPLEIRRAESALDESTTPPGNEHGWRPLLERIAQRYAVEPSCVILAPGTSMANFVACAALLEAGDEVLVEHPVYDPLRIVPEFLHASVRYFERREANGYRLDVAAIESAMTPNTRVIVITNLQNPTGAFDTKEDLEQLAGLAEARDVYVVVDEVYLDWVRGHPQSVPSAINISSRFVSTSSLTKVYGLAALRAGWILAEPAVADKMRRLASLFFNYSPHPVERLAALALDQADETLATHRRRVDTNRALVSAFVESHPPLRWSPPLGGTIGFVRVDREDAEAFVAKAHAEYGVLLVPGRFFGDSTGFRIGFGMDTVVVEEGLDRLSQLVRAL